MTGRSRGHHPSPRPGGPDAGQAGGPPPAAPARPAGISAPPEPPGLRGPLRPGGIQELTVMSSRVTPGACSIRIGDHEPPVPRPRSRQSRITVSR